MIRDPATQDFLAGQVPELARFSGWYRFLTVAARFPGLSAQNVLLLAAQCPRATAIAGYDDWRARGRQVTEGQRAIRLLDPRGGSDESRVLPVFDITQTVALDPVASPGPVGAPTVAVLPAVERVGDVDPGMSRFERESVAMVIGMAAGVDRWRRLPDPPEQWAGDPTRALVSAQRVLDSAFRGRAAASDDRAGRLTAPTLLRSDEVPGPPDREVLVAAHLAALEFYRDQCDRSWVPAYLRGRGLGELLDPGSRWRIGWAPDGWTSLIDHLGARGFAGPVLEAAGLACRSRRGTVVDRFRDRLMIPVHDPGDGAVVGFVGRANPAVGPDVPRYLNSPETAVYHKSGLLCGLVEGRPALAAGARPVLVEGPLDAAAITLAGQGRFVGIAASGTAPSGAHIGVLDHAVGGLGHRGVVVAFDADPAGRQAALRAHALIEGIVPSPRALCLALPDGRDPADLLRTDGAAVLSDLLITADLRLVDLAVDERIRRWGVETVEGRVSAVRDAAPLIARQTPAEMTRQMRRLADRLDLAASTVTGAIADALTTADRWSLGAHRCADDRTGRGMAVSRHQIGRSDARRRVGARLRRSR